MKILKGILIGLLASTSVQAVSYNIIEDSETELYLVMSGTGLETANYNSHWTVNVDLQAQTFHTSYTPQGFDEMLWSPDSSPYRIEYFEPWYADGSVSFTWQYLNYVETKILNLDTHGTSDVNQWDWSIAFYGVAHDYGYPPASPFGTTQIRTGYPVYNTPEGGPTALMAAFGFIALAGFRAVTRSQTPLSVGSPLQS
jgi:hypothetical protein